MKKKIIIPLLILSIAYFIIYLFQIPVFHQLRHWVWSYNYKPLFSWYFLVIDFAIFIFIAFNLLKKKFSNFAAISSIIALGVFHQFALEFSEGKGVQVHIDKMLNSGHGEFVKCAVNYPDLFSTIYNYENLIEQNKLMRFPNSKPPGTLSAYIIMYKISNILIPTNNYEQKLYNTAIVSTYIFPIISLLLIIPVFLMINKRINQLTAIICSLLYISTPALNLIIMHLDIVLFPLLFVSSIGLFYSAVLRKSKFLMLVSGIFNYLIIFVSFSLMPVFVFSALIFGCLYLKYITDKSSNSKNDILGLSIQVTFYFIGLGLMYILFSQFLNYNIILRYYRAMEYHFAWNHWVNAPKYILYFAWFNTMEYLCGIGIALSYFFAFSISNYAKRINRVKNIVKANKLKIGRIFEVKDLVKITTSFILITYIILAFFGKTKAETARLWLFLTPFICLITADYIINHFKKDYKSAITIILILQLITTYILKFSQDFENLS